MCDFCEYTIPILENKFESNNETFINDVCIDNGNLVLFNSIKLNNINKKISKNIKINYCPFCGRKLC